MSIEVRAAGDRYVSEVDGRTTQHSFSFGPYYDPANVGFASMVALNDEHLPPGTGYPDHRHSDLEIITWVLNGALRHTDGDGASQVLEPGDLQQISAGSGITHAEVTEPGEHTRFLQTWLRPDVPGGVPAYHRTHWDGGPQLTPVVTVGAASLHLAQATAGPLHLPDAPLLHLFVADGSIELGDRRLHAGDAARLLDEGQRTLVVPDSATVSVWAFRN